jgi:hypothetical protein
MCGKPQNRKRAFLPQRRAAVRKDRAERLFMGL